MSKRSTRMATASRISVDHLGGGGELAGPSMDPEVREEDSGVSITHPVMAKREVHSHGASRIVLSCQPTRNAATARRVAGSVGAPALPPRRRARVASLGSLRAQSRETA